MTDARDRSTEASNDAEIRAMMALKRYLEPLDRSARQRAMAWAKDRYVDLELPDLPLDTITTFTENLRQAAAQMGNIKPIQIIEAVTKIRELAPAEEEDAA